MSTDHPHEPTAKTHHGSPDQPTAMGTAGRGLEFHGMRRFAGKSVLLAVITLAMVPILLWQNALAAQLYLAVLVIIHIVGIAVFAWGVRRHDIAPNRRGLVGRIIGLTVLVILLAAAAKGAQDPSTGPYFWASLAAVWLLHAAGLLLMHVRTRREQALVDLAPPGS